MFNMSGVRISFSTMFYKLVYSQFGWVILLILSWEGGCLSTLARSSSASKRSVPLSNHITMPNSKNGNSPNMMDTKFAFNFDWDGEPPEFISQLDLEVKWEDDEEGGVTLSPPSRVSLRNVTMDKDYDITGPMTKLITSVTNTSFHEGHMNNMEKDNGNETMRTTASTESKLGSCSCKEINSIIKDLQMRFVSPTTSKPPRVNKGDSGDDPQRKKRGCKRCKGEKGQPGLTIVGPKGEPGHPGLLPYHLLHPENLKGERGAPGQRGPPGQCPMTCSNSGLAPAQLHNYPPPLTSTVRPTSSLPLASSNYRIVPGALVFKTLPSLLKMSTYVMLGSVAFVEESEEFYGKVKNGWRKFQMGPLIT